ncbi:MAG: glutamine--tRNA ligase/YqeY domain fusion protein [Longimicrobiales bacterium]|nr:glutamine--tRNA ligase/YqeY domain fusion protein [Longimicrobiales bacterium]
MADAPDTPTTQDEPRARRDFIRAIIDRDLEEGRYDEVVTRFPPEPNGYLHIGHAKSICLNFGLAEAYGGRCNLRYDDTNPITEEEEYSDAIARDVRWLGFEWDALCHASDYFERLYEVAERLVRDGKAYVDSSPEEEIREARGTVTEPGRPTRDRERSVEENLDLFRRMRAGEFEDGAHVLRAKADLASPNMIMRDPVLYRIRHATHYRTGDAWCIYPLYDFAHCLEDAFEGITHSLCTLEFDNNREIYDWILDHAGFEEPRNHQYEFARLNLDYTLLSKRKLRRLVEEGHVEGWDDPRMPTLAGLRRRGVPPAAIRAFCAMIGVAKADSRVDIGKLEYTIRDTLNAAAPRAMAVLDPIPLEVVNWPADRVETLTTERFPGVRTPEGEAETREIRFSQHLFIERDDFSDDPPEGWRRLAPGREVRLRGAYTVVCEEVIRDGDDAVVGVRGRIDEETLGRTPPDREVSGTIHWISEEDAVRAEVRLYDRLFSVPDPEEDPDGGMEEERDFTDALNPESLRVIEDALVPSDLVGLEPGQGVQFERVGYFAPDPASTAAAPIFNRVVTLRDTWARRAEATHPRGGGRPERVVIHQTAEDRISDERAAARAADGTLAERFARYRDALGLTLEEADLLTGTREIGNLFEAALVEHDAPGDVASWVVNDVRALLGARSPGELGFDGASLGRLVAMVARDEVSRRAAKEVLEAMDSTGRDPETVVAERGLAKISDAAELEPVVCDVLAAWPGKVAEYRAGNHNLLGLFMGEVMKATRGSADPGRARNLLIRALEEES